MKGIQLPAAFIDRMKSRLGDDEGERFLASYLELKTTGLRVNPLKLDYHSEIFVNIMNEFHCSQVPWCAQGLYYDDETRPGKHPYHAAGLYYIQEPSAMSAVERLEPTPGDIVLDLAAAPGGKATHIAGKLAGQGLLIANEIHPGRAKILSENIERWGAANCIVTSASPEQLAVRFPAFFDKIMLDAPCSGEGMFRKDPDAIQEWSLDNVRMCAARQAEILPHAVAMLKPGGVMVYSTCTFAEEENELMVESLIQRFPVMQCLKTERIWPHLAKGEGHFVAVLKKREDASCDHHDQTDSYRSESRQKRSKLGNKRSKNMHDTKDTQAAWHLFKAFMADFQPSLQLDVGEPLMFGDHLYWFPSTDRSWLHLDHFDGVKVLRPGLHLAVYKKNRIEPAHALAVSTDILNDPRHLLNNRRLVSLAPEDERLKAYLRGETIYVEAMDDGWCLVAVDRIPLGWGKAHAGQIKNHYPKGLRSW